MRKLLSVLAGLLLCILFSAACASGTVKVSVTGGMGVYSISREAYIRSSDGVPDSLGGDEYIGSDDSTFWIITSGVEGLCRLPKSGSEFSVKNVSTDQPY